MPSEQLAMVLLLKFRLIPGICNFFPVQQIINLPECSAARTLERDRFKIIWTLACQVKLVF